MDRPETSDRLSEAKLCWARLALMANSISVDREGGGEERDGTGIVMTHSRSVMMHAPAMDAVPPQR